MRKCIWCRRTDSETDFKNEAHTIPKQLGGHNLCENVYDDCNRHFGNAHNKLPAIETVIKETFNISGFICFKSDNDVRKNEYISNQQ